MRRIDGLTACDPISSKIVTVRLDGGGHFALTQFLDRHCQPIPHRFGDEAAEQRTVEYLLLQIRVFCRYKLTVRPQSGPEIESLSDFINIRALIAPNIGALDGNFFVVIVVVVDCLIDWIEGMGLILFDHLRTDRLFR